MSETETIDITTSDAATCKKIEKEGCAMAGQVAVVEDDESVRELVTAILEARGYGVAAFGTINAARDAFRHSVPDLLITDVRLPDGCGLDLIGSLRTDTGRKVPAIVLSGAREEVDFVRGFAAGAADYLSKPFSRDELLARCAVHLARTNAMDQGSDLEISLPEKNGLAFGRYAVTKELGRGGYGIVYLAHDMEREGAVVALKVLSPLSSEQPEARLRFIRETYALSAVKSKHIVPVHDVGCVQGRLYFAMDYVEGESLHTYVAKHGPLQEHEAKQLAKGLLEAFAVLGEAGLIHRDLKPANVILRNGRVDEPVLIDFGLAKQPFDRGITAPEILLGTISYLPPEVIRGFAPDQRSDLFALGATLRYALSGDELFPQLEGFDLLSAIATGPIPMPSTRLSRGFAAFLFRLLQVEPNRRFDSAQTALQVLATA